MASRNEKLICLEDFYNAFYDSPETASKFCPFTKIKDKIMCSELCFEFEKLDNEEKCCPCHVFGPNLAMNKLENLLIEEGLINESVQLI